MPTARKSTDKYANVLYDSVTESDTNTLTFEAVDVGLNIFDKVGLLVSRIEYHGVWVKLVDDADTLEFGLSSSNGWTDPDPAETSIIDYNKLLLREVGTAAAAVWNLDPYIKDLSNLPGGGLLITPKPLYMYAQGASLVSAASVKMRMFFTVIPLKPEEYFELLEARQYFG